VLTHPDGEGIISDPASRHYGSCPRSHEDSCCAGVGQGASVTNTAGHEHRSRTQLLCWRWSGSIWSAPRHSYISLYIYICIYLIFIYVYTYVYVYIHVCVCVCVCVCVAPRQKAYIYIYYICTYIHIYYVYIYIHMYVCMYVYVCICMYVCIYIIQI
jgi:hypothetical protein